MRAAGLQAIDTVLESTAILIKSKNSKHDLVNLITSRISGVISKSPTVKQETQTLTLLFPSSRQKVRPMPI